VTSGNATALCGLRCLWHGAYAIGVTDGIWVARRLDNPTRILTADTAPGVPLAAARRLRSVAADRDLNRRAQARIDVQCNAGSKRLQYARPWWRHRMVQHGHCQQDRYQRGQRHISPPR
jgi:hypothetical protein